MALANKSHKDEDSLPLHNHLHNEYGNKIVLSTVYVVTPLTLSSGHQEKPPPQQQQQQQQPVQTDWLSVWSNLHMVQQMPINLCFIQIQNDSTFLESLYLVKRCCILYSQNVD